MARIIEHGNERQFKRDAYIGRKARCGSCGCVWMLEKDDKFTVYSGGITAGLTYAICPECGNTRTDGNPHVDKFIQLIS